MDFPFIYHLKRPLYSYSSEARKTHYDKLRGLLQHTPFKAPKITEPKCMFVFTEDDAQNANKLYLSLRNGIAKFPGCKQLTGISLEKENVEAIRVPKKNDSNLADAFYDSINSQLSNVNKKPDFAFILYSKQPNFNVKDPYESAKAALTKHGVPSQYVSYELLDSPKQFQYAISNIALSFFVKLGGVPWEVSLRREPPTLVLGIGHIEAKNPEGKPLPQLIGFAVCTLSNGIYLNTSFFPPAKTYEEFLLHLEKGLREALDKMVQEYQDIGKITIHVSRLERSDILRVVKDTIVSYEKKLQSPIYFEMVRLTEDSDFSVFDQSHPGYVSVEGTVVALGRNHALVVTEGREEKAVWRGRKPVTLEMYREYNSSSAMQLRDTIEDAFALSSVNWRGFNAITQPISLQYAKLLAKQVAKMSNVEPQICDYIQQHPDFSLVPWFI